MDKQERLNKIVAKLQWYLKQNYAKMSNGDSFDADAERGWRATIEIIEECRYLIGPSENHKDWSESEYVAQGVIARIIESWPEEVL